jgi:TolB-like protein
MEYLEGDTLADRLRSGPLPIDEALRLGAQTAAAVSAAHARRIIHRDLKPANIKLAANGVKILDFGLAKILDSDASAGKTADAVTLMSTRPHTILGTAAYMSPEQARGGSLDHRTDVWSFGVVLYEMLTGKRLFAGGNPSEVMAAVLRGEFDATAALPRGTTAALYSLLPRLLERDPGQRLDDLALAASVLTQEVQGTIGAPVMPASSTDQKSILVLPFANSSPDAENEYFSDGLTEELIADLSKVEALRVISRTTAMRLKGTTKPLATLARELDVRYALEGSVRKAGENLRITAQLVDTRTDGTLWSDKYGGTLEDVFAIQEQVSRAIVEALRLRLDETADRKLVAPARPNGYVYDTYLRARRDIGSFVLERLQRAEAEVKHALAVVGDNPLLYSSLGSVYWQYINAGLSGDRRYIDEATKCAQKVLELEPRGPQGPKLLGLIATQSGDVVGWVRNLKRAVEIDPHDPDAVVWLGFGWMIAGFPQHARPLFEKLLTTDPHFDYLMFGFGFDGYFSGDLARAEAFYKKGQELSPDHPGVVMTLVQTYGAAGDLERAKRVAEENLPDPKAHPLATLTHVLKHALLGEREAAEALVSDEWAEKLWSDFQYTHVMAQAQALLGKNAEALRWLERATQRGFIHYPFLSERDSLLRNLHGDSGFTALLERVRVQWEGFEAAVGAT